MFRLFSRARRNAPVTQRRSAPLTLERLENRDCPSTISLNIASYAQNKMVTLSGQVTNTPSPGGLTVQLSGAVSGTTTTDQMGDFSVTLQATALSNVYAATSDGLSNTAQVLLTDQAPTWTYFVAVGYGGNMWMLTGGASGQNLGGDVVTFSGLNSLTGVTTTLNNYGSFYLFIQLDGQSNDNGFAQAQVTDWFGETSTIAVAFVST